MMWSFWRSRERFSLEELKYLNEQLQRVTVINESNKDFVIETLRSMAELLIWGDQNDPSFFEFFMEKQVMAHFARILKHSKTVSVAIQLLQTLNIMLQSMRSNQTLYYLFSNEYINNLITYPFDFQNEELVAYYISFLRTISTKLDKNTVSFFVKTENDVVVAFPLYTEAIKFAYHEESMVRIAVRTLTLNIYNIDDDSIRAFVIRPGVVDYFQELTTSIRQHTFKLVDLVTEAAKNPESLLIIGRLEEAIAEVGDLLYYCNDIINAGISGLSRLMAKHMLELLVVPVLIPCLHPFQGTEMQNNELSSLYMLSCLLQVVKQVDLVNGIGLELLKKRSCKDERVSPDIQSAENSLHKRKERFFNQSSRELLLSYLFCENDKLVLASLNVLVALLQNKALDETLLDALGILPQRKQYKKLLLQALVGNHSDEELLFSSPPSEGDDTVDLSIMVASDLAMEEQEADLRSVGEEASCSGDESNEKALCSRVSHDDSTSEPVCGSEVVQLSSRRNRYQVLDALMRLLCRRPPPCAEALWHTGWLLRQLLPYHEQKLRDHHLRMLNQAYVAAQEDLKAEVRDCWCDLIPTLLVEEWKMCKKASETPAPKKDTSFVLWPNPTRTFPNGDQSSSFVGERMQAHVKVFVILQQLRTLVLEGSIPDVPQLNQPKDQAERGTGRSGIQLTAIKRDTEIDLTPGDAIPCRIAFERGKERAVYLLVFSKGTAGWLMLAEDVPLRPRRGVLRVIAALAGSNPKVDEDHPKWLHLRIRSPHYPSVEVGKMGTGRSRARRLVDGRWTLAFPDEKTCKHAHAVVMKEMGIQRMLVEQVLEPLLSVPVIGTSNENPADSRTCINSLESSLRHFSLPE